MGCQTFSALYDNETGFWIPSAGMNALFHIDNDGTSRYAGLFSSAKNPSGWQIAKALRVKDDLFFFSRYGYELWRMNLVSNQMGHYDFFNDPLMVISNVEYCGDAIWIFPNTFEIPICRLDPLSMTAQRISWNCDASLGAFSTTKIICHGNKMYFATRAVDRIFIGELDCITNEITYYPVSNAQYVNCMETSGDEIWLLYRRKDEKTMLGRFDFQGKQKDETNISENIVMDGSPKMLFFKMIRYGENIFIIPTKDVNIYCFHIPSKKVNCINVFQKDAIEKYDQIFNDVQICGETAYIFSPTLNEIYKLELNEAACKEAHVEIGDGSFAMAIANRENGQSPLMEGKGLSLSPLLEYLRLMETDRLSAAPVCGEDIYHEIIRI